jgi:GntR family transcriptional regulator, arabinose operon transcriptional repressor
MAPRKTENIPGTETRGNGRAEKKARRRVASSEAPLHRIIYDELLREVQGGLYKPGDRIPSEALLCERFGASRITVARAIQNLQREGLVRRRPGSGTYVESPQVGTHQFGLLIPDLGRTEIFGPICRGMVLGKRGRAHSLSWGFEGDSSEATTDSAEQLCQQYIAQRVSGIFFAPFAHHPDSHKVNLRIADALQKAHMPTVLLDHGIEPYPRQDSFDRVSINHYAAGYELAQHLLQQGARRIVFVCRHLPPPTIDARFAGYSIALASLAAKYNASAEPTRCLLEPGEVDVLQTLLQTTGADALLCANDVTATTTMQMLSTLGLSVPGDIRITGVDDVRYAQLLPIPLTTIRQDCAEIGQTAMSLMLDRVERPDAAPRIVLVNHELIVRASCGAPPQAASRN